MGKFITKDEDGYERIVMGEVLIPNTLNTYGDFHTEESVRQFAYGFMKKGFGIDIDHDNVDVSGDIDIIESFIARPGDPDFVEGSWVVGCHIKSDELWQRVLDGELHGYSYEAIVGMMEIEITVPAESTKHGTTQPDLDDGHTHEFYVLLDANGRVLTGGTSETGGHTHTISHHTFTDVALGHSHIFNIVQGSGGL